MHCNNNGGDIGRHAACFLVEYILKVKLEILQCSENTSISLKYNFKRQRKKILRMRIGQKCGVTRRGMYNKVRDILCDIKM